MSGLQPCGHPDTEIVIDDGGCYCDECQRDDRFTRSRPDGRIHHAVKPDRDNLNKLVFDAMESVCFLKNDSRVSRGPASKFYVARGESPGLHMSVWQLEG